MRDVAIIGVGMTDFGKHLDKTLKKLAVAALKPTFDMATCDKKDVQIAYVGNAMAGLVTGQECIRGQVMLRAFGIGDIPVVNVENACASSSTAFQNAWMAVASGAYDCALALGVEKLYHEDKKVSFKALASAMDVDLFRGVNVEQMQKIAAKQDAGKDLKDEKPEKKEKSEGGGARSIFMDAYAAAARAHMKKYGTTAEHLAKIASKNHYHSSLNPHAQYRECYTVEEVLASPIVAPPLTRLMCSPIGDGAAAVIVCSKDMAKRFTQKPVWVAASVLRSGMDRKGDTPDIVNRTGTEAYEKSGLGPKDIHVAEVHDATAFGELAATEELGFCERGQGGPFAWDGNTTLGGKLPVNVSGGLESKGHPVGASGTAQITEIVWQLLGQGDKRQVKGAKVGLTQNGGGALGGEAAAMCVSILKV